MMRRPGGFMDQMRGDFRSGSILTKLIIVNIAVFVIAILWMIVGKLMKSDAMLMYGELPSFAWWLAGTSKLEVLMYKPWSVLTYMFLHVGFFHILLNMLMLYFSGKMFEQLLGSKRILSTYILGGVVAALVHIAASNSFPLLRDAIPVGGDVLLGASGSVMAVFAAIATYAPRLQIRLFGIIPVQLMWIAIIFIGLDFLRLAAQDGVAHFAHLGGAAYGFFMARSLKKGKYIAKWFDRFIDNLVSLFKPGQRRSRMKVKYSRKGPSAGQPDYRRMSDEEYNQVKKKEQDEIDNILDKISKSGYDSLSKKEKEILFRASNNR